jgi:sugar/nucleoside kinase (ribokinase family)
LAERARRILCAGIAVEDIVMWVEQFPAPGTKASASDLRTTGGGCAANAAVAVVRLGGEAAFAGPLGGIDDAASDRIVTNLEAEGVDCGGVMRIAGAAASVSLIMIDAAGEKTIATRRGRGLANALPRDADALVAKADAVLADNRLPDFAAAICRAARARQIPVVIDLDLATRPDAPLLSLGTHVIASAEALRATTGCSEFGPGLACLAAHCSGFLAVTDGPNGIYWRDGERLRQLPAFTVQAIDTLGAGDVFHGAFTLALTHARPMTEALRFASAAAALKCTRFGGGAGAPGWEEVEAFLSRNRSASS